MSQKWFGGTLTFLALGVCLWLTSSLLGLRPAHAQPYLGKYQIAAGPEGLYFLDTETGDLWLRANTAAKDGKTVKKWVTQNSPTRP